VSPVGPRKRAERRGKLVSLERRRRCVRHVHQAHRVSERGACRVLGQSRTSQRYQAIAALDDEPPTAAIVRLASQYGRYGHQQITALLRRAPQRRDLLPLERDPGAHPAMAPPL